MFDGCARFVRRANACFWISSSSSSFISREILIGPLESLEMNDVWSHPLHGTHHKWHSNRLQFKPLLDALNIPSTAAVAADATENRMNLIARHPYLSSSPLHWLCYYGQYRHLKRLFSNKHTQIAEFWNGNPFEFALQGSKRLSSTIQVMYFFVMYFYILSLSLSLL
jgi:hypothetical protein